jgi:hypothetical protein
LQVEGADYSIPVTSKAAVGKGTDLLPEFQVTEVSPKPPSNGGAKGTSPFQKRHTIFPKFRSSSKNVAGSILKNGCGHPCTAQHKDKCCHCTDARPKQIDGTYLVFNEDKGWTKRGNRNDGYCGVCKER